MGGTNTTPNVSLDFSQAQPVQQGAQPGSQTSGQPGQVTLDFSKAEPTVVSMVGPQGDKQQVPVENVTAMRQKNYAVTPDNPGVTKMSSPEGKTTYALPSEVDQFKASGHVVNGYREHADLKKGGIEYTYTPGQKALDANHPEMSVDDQGNVYYKGQPLKADTTPLAPTPGLSALAGKAIVPVASAAGTAAGTAVKLARTPVGKTALEFGLKLAAGGTGLALAKKWGLL